MLPDYECQHGFLAWSLADGDVIQFDYLMEKRYSELKLLYGYKRTQMYLAVTKDDTDDESSAG
jgi:hypothetical protein